MRERIFYILPICLMLIPGCIETFDPVFEEYENLLVIDGFITNKKETYEVQISRSANLNENIYQKVSGAKVKMIDNQGFESGWFKEVSEGVYHSDSTSFQGITGRSYKLHVEMDDEVYESEDEFLRPVPEIDSLNWKQDTITDEKGNLINGIQVSLNTHDPENNTRYYKWEWEETWEFSARFYVPDIAPDKTCFKNGHSNNIIIGTSEDNAQDVMRNFPIRFVSDQSDRLRIKYSILVKQYALSRNAYLFWNKLLSVNNDLGSLFDPIPSSSPGNIKNITNPDERVLGFFHASCVEEKRIFIDKKDMPWMYVPDGFDYCTTIDLVREDSIVDPYLEDGWVPVANFFDPITEIEYLMMARDISCVDCTLTGDAEKPSFWQD